MQAKNIAKTLGALLLAASPLSRADDPPQPLNNEVRLGFYYIHYFSSADDLHGPFTPPGLNFSFDDVFTPYVAYVRRLSSHFQVEAAFGVPPLTNTVASGPAKVGSVPFNGQTISSARFAAPTVLLEYNLFDESHTWRPYVGLGVNYTYFYDRQSTAAGDAISGGPTRLSLTSSVGFAATAGITYQFNRHWSAHASYTIAQIHSDLTADTNGVIRQSHIEFWPGALVISGGYAF